MFPPLVPPSLPSLSLSLSPSPPCHRHGKRERESKREREREGERERERDVLSVIVLSTFFLSPLSFILYSLFPFPSSHPLRLISPHPRLICKISLLFFILSLSLSLPSFLSPFLTHHFPTSLLHPLRVYIPCFILSSLFHSFICLFNAIWRCFPKHCIFVLNLRSFRS